MKTALRRTLLALLALLTLLLVSSTGLTALAFQNPYDKYRSKEYSNQGYISEAEEAKLGEEVHAQRLGRLRILADRAPDEAHPAARQDRDQHRGADRERQGQNQPINDYISNLGNRLARKSERPNIRWQFFVVDDKAINAFATLGGRVHINTGLVAATTSEAQLASVMGHEIGHIVGRHGLENVKKAQRLGIGAAAASILGAIIGGNVGSIVDLAGNLIASGYLMKHSRDAEREADFLGLYNLDNAGYNTTGMVEMFQILNQISKSQPNSIGSIMSSHPPPMERAQNSAREIQEHLTASRSSRRITSSTDYERIRARLTTGTGSAPVRVRPRN